MGWGTKWVVAIAVMKLVVVALQARDTPPPSSGGAVALSGCPSHCGGVPIPFPFGIGENCSHPSSKTFQVNCTSNKPMLADYYGQLKFEVREISLLNSTVRVSTTMPPVCNSSWTFQPLWGSYNLRLAPAANVFAVLGCKILGFFDANTIINRDFANTSSSGDYIHINQTVGCVSACLDPQANRRTQPVEMGVCDDRCCQTSVDIHAWGYQTVGRKIDNVILTTLSNVTECFYTFVVEKGTFNFSGAKHDFLPKDSITTHLLAEWSIIMTCEEALKDRSSYACASSNSECVNSKTMGYNCRCMLGYEGNPYLSDGCRDVDECRSNNTVCPKDSICINTPGNYTCRSRLPSNIETTDSKKSTRGIAIGLGISSTLFLLFIALALCYKRWKKQSRKREKERHFRRNHDMLQQQLLLYPSEGVNITRLISFFTISDIKKASNNFDRSHIVGKGGHGTVYKGLMDLRVVAIKKSNVTVQSEIEGFINEIILLSQISHRNVVKLIGCCFEVEVPLLVYEFISNGTLADHLHIWNRETPLSWEDRLRIAIEISGALSYLHSSASISIFHRDIKSANILLDERLTTKISDFGASKFIEMDQTHVTTNIHGTIGYLDPEYMHTGQLTEKSDVYSLGVILVELVTGEKPTSKMKSQEERNLISHFIWAVKENKLIQVVEASIVYDDTREEIAKVARLAVDCLRLRGTERPTMKEVEVTLQGIRKSKVQKRLKAVAPKYEQEHVESVSYHSSSNSRSESTKLSSVKSMWASS